MRSEKPVHNTSKRVLWIVLLLFTWMILIIWRLAWLQVVKHEDYLSKARRNQIKELEVDATRGAILDREGRELALSLLSDSLFVDLKLLKDEERPKVANVLARALGSTEAELAGKLSGNSSFVWLRRKLAPDAAEAVRRAIVEHRLTGVAIKKEAQRFYPNDALASHLLGYVGAEDKGQAGLEQTQDKLLRGKPGEIALMKDASGRPFERREIPSLIGGQLMTTIDAVLQHKVEELLDEALKMTKAKGVSAIVLEPATGEILAMANAPTFNPNVRPKTADDLVRHNRAISFPYEPGSIFKLVTYSAAFEEGLATPADKVNCGNGKISIGKRVINDTHAYGVLSVADAFAKSSNVGAIRIAQRVGKERFLDYIGRFGFGRRTGIELPGESRGIVNPLEMWRPDSIGSVAIGQEVSVTLLQAVTAMAAIANGGIWVQPHVIKQITSQDDRILYEANPEKRRILNERSAAMMRELLERVVTHGTGRHAIHLSGYTAAGKTGTPQKVDEKTRAYSKTKYMPTFAGYVPATNPRFAIIVMLDEPIGLYHGGSVAAPIFNLIAEAALGDFVVPPDQKSFRESLSALSKKYEAEQSLENAQPHSEIVEQTSPHRSEPQKSGKQEIRKEPAIEVQSLKVKANISANLSASAVAKQLETGRQKSSPPNSRAALTMTGAPSMAMPDFRGRGVRAVMQVCADLKLNVKLHGSGVAVRQVPAPGSRVRAGEECKVEFQ